MKINFLLVGLLICTMVIISGCTTSCIPVTPTQVISTPSGSCIVVIDNTSYEVPRSSTCSKIVPNQINRVYFFANGGLGPGPSSSILGVCEP